MPAWGGNLPDQRHLVLTRSARERAVKKVGRRQGTIQQPMKIPLLARRAGELAVLYAAYPEQDNPEADGGVVHHRLRGGEPALSRLCRNRVHQRYRLHNGHRTAAVLLQLSVSLKTQPAEQYQLPPARSLLPRRPHEFQVMVC